MNHNDLTDRRDRQIENLRERLRIAIDALGTIRDARDHHADHGAYPEAPEGPDHTQSFDDWAADLADRVSEEIR